MKAKNLIDTALAVLATVAAYLFGPWSTILTTLIILILVDMASGWIRAIVQKKLSSEQSWRGILKKLLILAIVVVAHQADGLVGTANNLLRNATSLFYCANEGISILENAVAAGLPVPQALKDVLKKLNGEKFKDNDSSGDK